MGKKIIKILDAIFLIINLFGENRGLAQIVVGFQNNFSFIYFDPKYTFGENLPKIRFVNWTLKLKI